MSGEPSLPPLREVIAALGLSARKSLGQNFLLDLNLTRRIARAAGPLEGHTIIEVGPGPGGLTRALLMEGAQRVVAVERDQRMLPALEAIAEAWPGKLTIVAGDALETDWPSLGKPPFKVVANLPYNIATPLLVGWLKASPWPPWWTSLTIMFQKEVALRIVAAPGTADYGRLSVLAQWRSSPLRLFDVDPRAFVPAPQVTSSIVHITPAIPRAECGVAQIERITAAAFGQRRKMLRANLKALAPDAEARLAAAGIDPTRRAESLSIEEFGLLATLFSN
ncbi:MAG: 16S rRNA (adenine(1518)-N(6)/adenine(1519)-N(6))-dimethyltransferase RsmA [Parvibaculaceae bacterium]